jgi:Mn-dependent DtxR family transcriptional regulator
MKRSNDELPSFHDTLHSKVATAALRILIEHDTPLPISRIAKEMGSNFVTVRRHVTRLEEMNLVKSINYGKRKLYKANMNNERIVAFKNFIQIWNDPKKHT